MFAVLIVSRLRHLTSSLTVDSIPFAEVWLHCIQVVVCIDTCTTLDSALLQFVILQMLTKLQEKYRVVNIAVFLLLHYLLQYFFCIVTHIAMLLFLSIAYGRPTEILLGPYFGSSC